MTTPDKSVPAGWLSLVEICSRLGPVRRRDVVQALELIATADDHWAGRQHNGRHASATFFPPHIVPILADYLLKPDLAAARDRLAAGSVPPPSPDIIPEPEPPPEVISEDLRVISRPRQWPNGQVSHFGNPQLIECLRADGKTRVYVRVHHSRTYTTVARDGNPMTVRARFGGNPRNWTALDRPPAYIGATSGGHRP